MAVLSIKQRKRLPKKDFAIPSLKGKKNKFGKKGNKAGDGAFPMPNKAHAKAAVRLAPLSYDKGNISKNEEKTIIRRGDKMLKRKPSALIKKDIKRKKR